MRQYISIKTDNQGNRVALMRNGNGSYVELTESDLVKQIDIKLHFWVDSTIQDELALNELRDTELPEIPQMAGTRDALEKVSIIKPTDRNMGQKTLQDFMGAPKDFALVGKEAEKDGVDIITVKHKATGDVYYYSEHLQYKSLAEQVDDIGEYCCGWKYLQRP